ncbi:MAG: gamma-glutamyltransferase, partial [Proteobacteria bacterium]|nr:gamma-glutamyltransferase [Pseudomonadota bacterium]
MRNSEAIGANLRNDTATQHPGSIIHRIAITVVVALGMACTPAQQDLTTSSTYISTTSYAAQNRPDVRGMNGAVSADHPLAAQAGLRVLQEGGNATDAIIAMAGVLAVVRPHMNGIGGDAFGIFYDGASGEVTALNASGRAGQLATPEFFQAAGVERIPGSGALS